MGVGPVGKELHRLTLAAMISGDVRALSGWLDVRHGQGGCGGSSVLAFATDLGGDCLADVEMLRDPDALT